MVKAAAAEGRPGERAAPSPSPSPSSPPSSTSAEAQKINLYRLIPKLADAFATLELASVNGQVARIQLIRGTGTETTARGDRFVLVLDGECTLAVPDGTVRLLEGHAFKIPDGTRHTIRAVRMCLVLWIERPGNESATDGTA